MRRRARLPDQSGALSACYVRCRGAEFLYRGEEQKIVDFLTWLQTNGFSEWVLTTSWVYPWVISFHSIGMGFLVGVISMLALRTLGFGDFPIAPLERFLLVIRIAFIVNVASGLTLFVIQAEKFFYSPTFRVKMLLIALGIVSGWILSRQLFGERATEAAAPVQPQSAKVVAAITLTCWAGAIVAGRMTAYLP